MFAPQFELVKFSRISYPDDKLQLSVYYSKYQNAFHFHHHEFVELVLILDGEGTHSDGQNEIKLHRGDICVIPRGINHSYLKVSEDFSLINILFIPESLPISGLDAAQLPGFKSILTGISPDEKEKSISFHIDDEKTFKTLETLAFILMDEIEAFQPGKNFVSLGTFMAILGKIARCYSAGHNFLKFNYDSIAKVIAYLNKNYREDVSIAKLCKIGSMSKSSLMRNFKKTTGVSPLQYMLNLRLGDVAVLLRSTGKQFYEIAGICGFNDVNYMGRKFKQFQDVTLREYRKKYQYTDIVRE